MRTSRDISVSASLMNACLLHKADNEITAGFFFSAMNFGFFDKITDDKR